MSISEELAISIPLTELPETASQPPSWFRTCSSMLHHVHVGILLGVYASLIELLQLKYQSKKESVFETHTCFMSISMAAIIIFAPTYWILYHINNKNSNTTTRLSSPSLPHMILVSLAFFSIILAILSLVFVLLLPQNLMWIGYLATCLLIIAILAYTSIDKVISLGRNTHMEISNLVNYIRNKL
ncbi:unnamed protein product [Lactuca virosa]|uniref:Uncharacterized protein n=1 Tax=Lactuca virosa TaxID=75947 RepID=A0AAU9PCF5_9ASTR|nr:unnamed protein product [Lactuca virosa]